MTNISNYEDTYTTIKNESTAWIDAISDLAQQLFSKSI